MASAAIQMLNVMLWARVGRRHVHLQEAAHQPAAQAHDQEQVQGAGAQAYRGTSQG